MNANGSNYASIGETLVLGWIKKTGIVIMIAGILTVISGGIAISPLGEEDLGQQIYFLMFVPLGIDIAVLLHFYQTVRRPITEIVCGIFIAFCFMITGIMTWSVTDESKFAWGMDMVIGVGVFVWGLLRLLKPQNVVFLRKDPYYIQKVNEIQESKFFENKYFWISQNYIMSKINKKILYPTNEIYLIYITSESLNGIITMTKYLVFEMAQGTKRIDMYGMREDVLMEMIYALTSCCPYAKLGNEDRAYLKQMRAEYKRNRKMQ